MSNAHNKSNPLPGQWCALDHDGCDYADGAKRIVCDSRGTPLCDADTEALARQIVREHNAHNPLVNALELALATIARLSPPKPYDHTQGTRDVAAEALKLANANA